MRGSRGRRRRALFLRGREHLWVRVMLQQFRLLDRRWGGLRADAYKNERTQNKDGFGDEKDEDNL